MIRHVLHEAPGHTLTWAQLTQALKAKNLADVPVDVPKCRRDCMRLPLPSGPQLHQNLRELALRGDIQYSEGKPSSSRGSKFSGGVVSLVASPSMGEKNHGRV